MQTQARSRIPRLVFSVFIIAILGIAFWERQNIVDWWLLRDYTPPASVTSLATDTTMTGFGRKLFYVNHPQVQEKSSFYSSCEEGETSIVLGCYKRLNGIYLLKVDDSRLNGVEQVTAAHEMLHAAYDRLGTEERNRVKDMLTQAYASVTDENITKKITTYRQSGADVTNELHSIMGTEVADLPRALETYYQQYFSDRAKIVAYSAQYQSVFTSRKQQVDAYDTQLANIEKQVTANNQSLTAQENALNAESARLNDLLQQQQIAEYNQGVIAYNQSLKPYRTLLANTKALVEQYKTILTQRNQAAAEAQELSKALDSRIQTTVTTK